MPESPFGEISSTLPLVSTIMWSPMIIAGDANDPIHWSFLLWTCSYHHAIWRFTPVNGLDCVFISSNCTIPVRIHSGDHCDEIPICCVTRVQSLLVRCTTDSFEKIRRDASSSSQRLGLLHAHGDLLHWNSQFLLCGPLPVSTGPHLWKKSTIRSPFSCNMHPTSIPSPQTAILVDFGIRMCGTQWSSRCMDPSIQYSFSVLFPQCQMFLTILSIKLFNLVCGVLSHPRF